MFFFNIPATTEIYTLSLHDALPILQGGAMSIKVGVQGRVILGPMGAPGQVGIPLRDRKSTRLNSSHTVISYAVFCLKKKKQLGDDLVDQPERLQPAGGDSQDVGSLG